MTPTLYADKGEVTVAPQKATYIYGAFNVQIPEGKKLAEQDYRFKDATSTNRKPPVKQADSTYRSDAQTLSSTLKPSTQPSSTP
ncbi:hypothetical protein [Corynebacterium renale]|uniref:hypothetical protein n=1 Tax=Corynebacterium renale TaxID=1724 RepID=UPI000653E8FA|nr:hypothetical protein [Corynebacterium renale]